MQALKALPLVAPVDAAHCSRKPAWATEVEAASKIAQMKIALMLPLRRLKALPRRNLGGSPGKGKSQCPDVALHLFAALSISPVRSSRRRIRRGAETSRPAPRSG